MVDDRFTSSFSENVESKLGWMTQFSSLVHLNDINLCFVHTSLTG